MNHFKKVIKILTIKLLKTIIVITCPVWFLLLVVTEGLFDAIFVPISKIIACIYTGRWDNNFHTLTKGGYYNISLDRFKNMFNKESKY